MNARIGKEVKLWLPSVVGRSTGALSRVMLM